MSDIEKKSRRNFLKKAAYSAPVIVGLGALVAPKAIHANFTASQTQRYDEYQGDISNWEDKTHYWSANTNGLNDKQEHKISKWDTQADKWNTKVDNWGTKNNWNDKWDTKMATWSDKMVKRDTKYENWTSQ
jgi:hypothetical protein